MTLFYATSFRRDYKRLCKRRWDIERLNTLIDHLASAEKCHTLKGKFFGIKECHVGFDWIVIYETSGDAMKLLRTGTHSEVL